MDGVLCDFETYFKSTIGGGLLPEEYKNTFGKKRYWDLIIKRGGSTFWESIPPTKDMDLLIDYVFENFEKIGILSSSSKKNHGSRLVTVGKIKWLKKHKITPFIPNDRIIIVDSAEDKRRYADVEIILVDDFVQNIKEWRTSGGIGILHTSAKKTIKELEYYA